MEALQSSRARVLLAAQICLGLLSLAACGAESDSATQAQRASEAAASDSDPDSSPQRSDDPRVVQARRALDLGHADVARDLVPQALAVAGKEGALLEARLAALSGDRLAALAHLERARREAPEDPRVYATAAEIHAADGKLADAEREIQRGIEAAGAASPELTRARGVHLICTPGQAASGLALLLRARQLDPTLPFMDRPLGQAHMLAAKKQLAAGDGAGALEAVRKSLQHDSEDLDTRRLETEILMGLGEWGEGIAGMESLLLEGLPLEAELAGYCKNAGFWAVTHNQRELGLQYYLRALALGFPRSELGHGLSILDAQAEILATQGAEQLAAGENAQALEVLQQAVRCDPESLQALNYLGHAHYLAGDLSQTVSAWNQVVDLARSEGIDLPEAVHIKLARVQAEMGEFEMARETLQAYMVLEPTGAWVESTRKLLADLPDAPLAQEQAASERQESGDLGDGQL